MNFSKFDMVLLVTMSIAVICLSFTLPALGLTEAGTNESDIPEFEMEPDRFNFVDQFPESPGTPSTGTLQWVESDPNIGQPNVWLDGDLEDGEQLGIINDGNESDIQMDVQLRNYSSSVATIEDSVILNETGEVKQLNGLGYQIRVDIVRQANVGTEDLEVDVRYRIDEQNTGEDTHWIRRVPLVGGVIGAADALAGIVGWIGSILFWVLGTLYQITLNLVGILYDVLSYLVAMMVWLTSTYGEVISSADSWAAVFVAIPGILLFLEFAKLILIAIKLLPTT